MNKLFCRKKFVRIIGSGAILALALCVVLSAGCGNGDRPKDMPKLYPVEVTVVCNGEPFPDATVSTAPTDTDTSKWAASGNTNVNGTAKLYTYGKFSGAVKGEHLITVHKNTFEDVATKDSDDNRLPPKMLVSPEFSDFNMTPLKIAVTERKADNSFQVEVTPPEKGDEMSWK